MPVARQRRLLYVSASRLVPAKLGPARRNHHIIDQLARFYNVSVISVGTPTEYQHFMSEFGHRLADVRFVAVPSSRLRKALVKVWRTATGRSDFLPSREVALRRAVRERTTAERFDAIVLSTLLLRTLPLPADVPVIGDTHNVEFDVFRRTASTAGGAIRRSYAWCQARLTANEERKCGRRASLVLATSSRDARLFNDALGLADVEVVPNGIDLDEFRPAEQLVPAPVIIFSGLLSYYPNQQGARWLLDEVLPLVRRRVPGVKLVIAGAAPPAWLLERRSPAVDVTGPVADMRPHLARATVAAAPLMIGGGTRVKILEALAMAKPVVSTTIGAEGLGLVHDETVLIGDDAATFATQLVQALTDRDRMARLTQAGRQHVIEHFDWNRIGEQLQRVLADRLGLVSHSRGHSRSTVAA
jgi:glycosyltransferase involved in cell wall biosynthesis